MRIGWILGGIATIAILVSAAALTLMNRAGSLTHQASPRRILLAPPEAKAASVAVLTEAAAKTPGDATVWTKLGNVHLRAMSFPAAIDAYKKALAIDPARSETWSALGEAQIQSQRSDTPAMPAEAKAAFDRALAIDPNDLRARFYRIMERDFAGQHDRAVGEWLAMLREAPMGSDADEAIRAALAASINRNLALIKAEMSRVTQVQPRIETKAPGRI